ncbi:MAG: GGDEF domain-containing protein [Candidatus Devosia euplotis]|nr:GGDEF domain-containing protein [Candidatus Devosia euplotis]
MAFSVVLTNVIMETFSAGAGTTGLVVAIVMPIVLGAPMALILTLKHEQLRHANHQLEQIVTTDWLTGCRTCGAFTRQVADHLERHPNTGGALLVADADNFKRVNDRFGSDIGDQALLLIADAIRAATAGSAIVGRLGGEEFGISLAGAGPGTADQLAEYIRRTVAAIAFITPNRLGVTASQ